PSDEDLEAVASLERKIQSGELLRPYYFPDRGPQTSVVLAAEQGSRTRPLRLHISPDLYLCFRDLERQFREHAGPARSFIAFLCTSLWQTWLPFLEQRHDKWRLIYARDRHTCTNAFCERRDITPHHVRFRAHGGG